MVYNIPAELADLRRKKGLRESASSAGNKTSIFFNKIPHQPEHRLVRVEHRVLPVVVDGVVVLECVAALVLEEALSLVPAFFVLLPPEKINNVSYRN